MKVISVHSDSALIVETDSRKYTYEEGDVICFRASSGFLVSGTVKSIYAESVTIVQDNGAVTEYLFKEISEIRD